ncbi:hypothetical protein QN277_009316 [Acacia crassicarpa]|nr:hypothetical protein QN277_009316 [Acacia crassicarpa]
MESGKDADVIQKGLGKLMEQIVFLLQLVFSKKKQMKFPVILRKELKETMRAAVRNITLVMIPSSYFRSIIKLLHHADKDVGDKALGLLCETARNHEVSSKSKESKTRSSNPCFPWLNMNESDQKSFDKMCLEIVRVLDDPAEGSNTSFKVAAVSALEVLANSFPSNNSIFVLCLRSVAKCISLCNLAVASSCLRTTAALINVLGPKALAEIPHIMENMMKLPSELFSNSDIKAQKSMELIPSVSKDSYLLSALITLEVVVDKLGGFLNPYLPNIIDLLVLHPEYISGMDAKVESRANGLRKLLAERIPVRLALPPLLKVYPASINAGDKSLEIMFDMLATLIGTMDRSSVVAFHRKIFDLCLLALDIRHQSPVSVHDIDAVEKSVIHAMVALTMKLTESMFKPLFIKSIEWAESDAGEAAPGGSTDRAISFYGMVNKLAESHRSLFVPYFKDLLGSCVHYLSNAGDILSRKKKKAKIQDDDSTKGGMVSIKSWRLRKLVLSCLHKCFLYDTGSSKFLDSSNFQMLLKPIVSQLVIEPPASLDDTPNMPSVKEVDDLLVVCVGHMAVTAGNDLLWKPLNHEVLMQSRSEKLRTRMLALRIIKYLVENLKEEYLVFLAETIPFLGELLEDVEPCVQDLAQEILKELESMSGESLRQYL